ncbi:MAG: DUF2911 domain-containing protein [Cyclobacteriaceae bacterium]|jgi:hypothetical protein|nr:DUF2911 domain-containing protein [Cyclobacteriaceae bacterium]
MKKLTIVLGILLALLLGAYLFIRFYYTKSFSPEQEVRYEADGTKISVFYNRPFKKGRVIFGGLVPYGQVWRTGANEATVFETNRDLLIQGKTLKAGKYSFFTQPDEQSWQFIFNSEYGQWGVDFNGQANRDPAKDVLTAEVPSVQQEKEFEQFTIAIEKDEEELLLVLMWDKTLVALPVEAK